MSTAFTAQVDTRPNASEFAWTLDKLVCFVLVALVVFTMGADFRGDRGEKFVVHWQIYMRLVIAGISGVYGFLVLFPQTYRDYLTWPGMLLTAYTLWYGVTLPASVNLSYSTAAWVSLVCVLLLVPAAMRGLGGYRILLAIAAGLACYLIGSWIAYLYFPAVGVFEEQISQTAVFERMGGLGHPNELGINCAYMILICAGLGVSRRISWWLAGLGMLFGAITLVACFSRTAMLVCSLGLVFTFQDYLRQRSNAAAVLAIIGILLLATFVSLGSGQLDWTIERTLKDVTKTGSTDELTTVTGRTVIWAYSIKKIKESPVFGYGYCASRFVMEDYSFHGHNIVLNAMLFGGILSGLIVLAMMAYQLYAITCFPIPAIDGLAVYIMTGGLVEGLLGAPSPCGSMVIWIVLLFWRQMHIQIVNPRLEA